MPAKAKPADPAAQLSEEAIRQRAYYLWEADGRPEGRGDHYWALAHAEATKDFIATTTDKVAAVTGGEGANTPPAAVKATKATKARVQDAPRPKPKADAKPAKKATKPRAAVPKAK